MSWMGSDEFHQHVDGCERCASQPFNLCDVGALLLRATAEKARDEKRTGFDWCPRCGQVSHAPNCPGRQ